MLDLGIKALTQSRREVCRDIDDEKAGYDRAHHTSESTKQHITAVCPDIGHLVGHARFGIDTTLRDLRDGIHIVRHLEVEPYLRYNEHHSRECKQPLSLFQVL